MEPVRNVEDIVIEVISLIILSAVDIRKKEIPMPGMIGTVLLWLYPFFRGNAMEPRSLLLGGIVFIFSLISRQAIGLADAVLLLLMGFKLDTYQLMRLLLEASIFLMIFVLFRFVVRGKTVRDVPFIPFLSLAYIFERLEVIL